MAIDLKAVLERASESEQIELKVLHKAMLGTMSAYNTAPSAASLKNWQAAREACDTLAATLAEKYGVDSDEPAKGLVFANKKAVHGWLTQNGWKISQAGFYAHCKEGRLRPAADGTYLQAAVERYAVLHVRRLESGLTVRDEAADLSGQRQKVEIALREEQRRLCELKRRRAEGDLIERSSVEIDLAGRAVALEAGLKHLARSSAPEWVALVGGRPDALPDLIAAVTASIDDLLRAYSAPMEFEVEWGGAEDAEEEIQ